MTNQQGSGNDAAQTMSVQRDNRGNLVSVTYNGTQYNFFLFDGLGSVAAITDPSGVAAGGYRYDPYGNIASYSGWLSTPFTFASGWTVVNTDGVHFGARWYAPATNLTRWTQQDPVAGSLGNPTSQCRYAYAHNDPVNEVDPSGAISVACGTAIIATGLDLAAVIAGAFNPVLFFLVVGFSVTSIVTGLQADRSAGTAFLSVGLFSGALNLGAFAEGALAYGVPGLDLVAAFLACRGG